MLPQCVSIKNKNTGYIQNYMSFLGVLVRLLIRLTIFLIHFIKRYNFIVKKHHPNSSYFEMVKTIKMISNLKPMLLQDIQSWLCAKFQFKHHVILITVDISIVSITIGYKVTKK